MKTIFSKLSILCLLAFAGQAKAQLANTGTSSKDIKFVFSADIGPITDSGVHLITTKYDKIKSAKIEFNRDVARLLVTKVPKDCPTDKICLNSSAESVTVNFKVLAIAFTQCFEKYYARSLPANTGSNDQIVEELWISRYMPERCQSTLQIPDGTLVYRATGVSSASGQIESAYASAELLNMTIKPSP